MTLDWNSTASQARGPCVAVVEALQVRGLSPVHWKRLGGLYSYNNVMGLISCNPSLNHNVKYICTQNLQVSVHRLNEVNTGLLIFFAFSFSPH